MLSPILGCGIILGCEVQVFALHRPPGYNNIEAAHHRTNSRCHGNNVDGLGFLERRLEVHGLARTPKAQQSALTLPCT